MKIAFYYRNKDAERKCREFSEQFDSCEIITGVDNLDNLKNFDAVTVFGGDGTVLEVAPFAAKYDLPVLCVNQGNLGFLSELKDNASPSDAKAILEQNNISEKMLLSVKIKGEEYLALNEVVLKSHISKPVYISAKINGEFFDEYRADGIIVCTPTGSTAYALSAGGPIISPEVDAFSIIPVCPHSLHSRPLVVSSADGITLSGIRKEDKICAIVDGRFVAEIDGNCTVSVSKSKYKVKFFTDVQNCFFKKLRAKMNRWGVTKD